MNNDPRIILKQKLIDVGILLKDATIISLDAGSSQVYINMEYLENFNYSKSICNRALSIIGMFYSGELFCEYE